MHQIKVIKSIYLGMLKVSILPDIMPRIWSGIRSYKPSAAIRSWSEMPVSWSEMPVSWSEMPVSCSILLRALRSAIARDCTPSITISNLRLDYMIDLQKFQNWCSNKLIICPL